MLSFPLILLLKLTSFLLFFCVILGLSPSFSYDILAFDALDIILFLGDGERMLFELPLIVGCIILILFYV